MVSPDFPTQISAALERHSEITVSPNMHTKNLKYFIKIALKNKQCCYMVKIFTGKFETATPTEAYINLTAIYCCNLVILPQLLPTRTAT